MARGGMHVLLLDKDTFPRDKICGDAISGKSVDVLAELGMLDRVKQTDNVVALGATFSSPDGTEVSIPFTGDMGRPKPPGLVCDRVTYDNALMDMAKQAGVDVREGVNVKGLIREGNRAVGIRTADAEFRAPLVIGADGAYSVIVRDLGLDQLDENHYVAGIRAYYDGVTGFHEHNFIELHFVEESLPGYFWMFPMSRGRANVGLGMLSSRIKKRDVKLKPLLDEVVAHPRFRERFAGATRVGPLKGWGLPLGSKPRQMAGDGWMLVGDAASLIDPFTGEGIGNAMVSGMFAAERALEAHRAGRYDRAFLDAYGRRVLDKLQYELRLSYNLQRMLSWHWLLNKVIQKAARSEDIKNAISIMFEDMQERGKLVSPMFYLRVLFA
jgi:geranylgeranyl reductase family protein